MLHTGLSGSSILLDCWLLNDVRAAKQNPLYMEYHFCMAANLDSVLNIEPLQYHYSKYI